jgi:hypothetical protein
MGAEDRDTWAERVSSGAVDRGVVEYTKAALTLSRGGSGCGVARGPVRRLEGEADTELYARTTCESKRRLRPSGPEFCM